MHCPFCQHEDTRVVDSRVSDDGASIRRRRECPSCGERFSTLETAEIKLPVIVKSDGRREAFDEPKLRTSFQRALQKRPVSAEQIDEAVRSVMHALRLSPEREVASLRIGEYVMAELKKLDLASVLIVIEAHDEKLLLAARNLPHVEVIAVSEINPVSLAAHDKVLMTVGAVKMIEERLQ